MNIFSHISSIKKWTGKILQKHSNISIFSCIILAGCNTTAQAPDFLILNSYFPSWLIGSLIALIITVLFRVLLIKSGIDDVLPVRFFVYVAFWLILTIAFSYIYSPR